MAELTITYESLYDVLRKEKTRAELQKLDSNFFKKVSVYIKEKNSILESHQKKSSIFAEKEIENTKKQIENTKKMLKELYNKRELKVLKLALSSSRINSKQDISSMLPEEKQLYDNIIKCLNESREDILNNLLNKNDSELEPKTIKTGEKDLKLVRFLNAVPKFVGNDLKVYGPFEQEDVANLPSKIAKLLIEKNKAEEI